MKRTKLQPATLKELARLQKIAEPEHPTLTELSQLQKNVEHVKTLNPINPHQQMLVDWKTRELNEQITSILEMCN